MNKPSKNDTNINKETTKERLSVGVGHKNPPSSKSAPSTKIAASTIQKDKRF